MRDYSLLFGLAALGLIVGCQQPPAPQRPAATPRVPPAATNGKVTLEQSPGSAPK
jgi:hypothetical protein